MTIVSITCLPPRRASHGFRPGSGPRRAGLFPENTLQSFAHALSIGVDTLELDVNVTRDDVLIVSHERRLNPDLARDGGGAYVTPPGAPFFHLSFAEVRNFDVGQIRPSSANAAQFPEQHVVPGTRIPTLKEVSALVRKLGDPRVRLNVEIKIDPDHPEESLTPWYVDKLKARTNVRTLPKR